MKVSELSGALLDKWVANAHGMMLYTPDWQPSRNWAQGGPLLERENIELSCEPRIHLWWANKYDEKAYSGDTPLEAAMRCYVASKLGEVVDDESI